jgi:SNF2 family DNA or RNA helicase
VGTAGAGTVTVVGDWLELRFEHSLRIVSLVRGLSGRRLEFGVWRVPLNELQAVVRLLEPFGFAWIAEAESLRREAIATERRLEEEDRQSLRVKAGLAEPCHWPLLGDLLIHQRLAAKFLAVRSGALLFDEQGLGKTLSTLAAFSALRGEGAVKKLLVICPNSLKYVWRDEITRFFPEWRVSVAAGYKGRRRQSYAQDTDVYVTNYEAARSDFTDLRLLLRRAPTVLVCDESHAGKNPRSRTAQSLAFLRSASERIWLLSGTPIPNRLEDAYAQVALASGTRILGTRDQFRSRFVRSQDRDGRIAELKSRLEPILLRRTKEEVLDLPEKVFEVRYVELTHQQRKLYDAIRHQIYEQIKAIPVEEFERALPNVLTRLLRLAQVASNPKLVFPNYEGDPPKLDEVDRLLEDLIEGNGRKVVLWSYYVQTIETCLSRYAKYSPVAVYGRVDIRGRREAVQRFQEDPTTSLFIGNPQAAGSGLTLTAAHDAIYETLTWRYDLYAQSVDRTHRIGQGKSVTYFKVIAYDTIDVVIARALDRKAELAADVLGDVDRATRFTKSDILQMLQ